MTSKKFHWAIKVFYAVVLILFITFSFGAFDKYLFPFNPGEDICLAVKHMDNTSCAIWRPKNICELNPNAEGCICDEWKNSECPKEGLLEGIDINIGCDYIFFSTNQTITIYSVNPCVKAHEPVCKEVCD